MQTKFIDGNTFRKILAGGARGIKLNINEINDLNVFPVPDGDTGTNMSKTIESGIAKIPSGDEVSLSEVASDFSRGSLFGARGNSGVILSQFFAGMCESLSGKETATPSELASAYIAGVKRSYSAVANPVEGTILTVFRESAEYAREHIDDNSTLEDFLALNIEEAERSLRRTKEILPVLTEADVVDSGGAGYLCIVKGMYDSLCGGTESAQSILDGTEAEALPPDYELFTADSELEYGYCTECLVRLQNKKTDITVFDEKPLVAELESLGCDSIVALTDGDVLKLHAHTKTPADILTLCQRYGEFLNVKIENMSLQHSERVAKQTKKKPHKRYGVVAVAMGEGMCALFESLGADVVISGGQTCNPSAEDFTRAFAELDADHILVFPNNKNILLTAEQAAKLAGGGNVTVVASKTMPEGYAALSVFNSSTEELSDQLSDIEAARASVVSGEITVAIRDTVIGDVSVTEGEYIGILGGELVSASSDVNEAVISLIEKIDDLDERELITLFVGCEVTDDARVSLTEALRDAFHELTVEVMIGGQKIYDYLIAVE